jgi:hypothetical protein
VLSGTQDKYQMGSRFCVSSLKRVASGAFKARKRIPADVRAEYQALYGPAWEVKLTTPRHHPTESQRVAHRVACGCRGPHSDRGRNGSDGGQDLTQRQAAALAVSDCVPGDRA